MVEQERAWQSKNIVDKLLITFAPLAYLIDFKCIFLIPKKMTVFLPVPYPPQRNLPSLQGFPACAEPVCLPAEISPNRF